MLLTTTKELKAYQAGVDAGQRTNKYAAITEKPECPYPENPRLAEIWEAGYTKGETDRSKSRMEF